MDEKRIVEGQRISGTVAGVMVALELLQLAARVATGAGHYSDALGRALLAGVLGWFTYLGRPWARWTMVGLLAFGGVLALLDGFRGSPLSAMLGLIYLTGAGVLAFVPSVRVFFDYARHV